MAEQWLEQSFDEADDDARAADPATGRRAWVGPDGQFYLLERDELLVDAFVPAYDPAWSTQARSVRFRGDEVELLFDEKHHLLLWVVPFEGDGKWWRPGRLVRMGSAGQSAARVGDLVGCVATPGLLELRVLPSLRALFPVPVPSAYPKLAMKDGALFADGGPVALPLPDEPLPTRAELLPLVAAGLGARADLDLSTAELLAGCALGSAFSPPAPVAYYEDLPYREPDWMQLFPVYFHEYLTSLDRPRAEAFLTALDRLATCASLQDADPVGRAVKHACREAGVWAAVCRTGRLPEHLFCYLWTSADRVKLDREPESLRAAFESVRATGPRSLSERN